MGSISRSGVAWILMLGSAVPAGDWHQWRGPSRNGIVSESPPLVEGFAAQGPKRLWLSDKLPSGSAGGWGSVTVAGGRAFVFSNWKYKVPIDTRTLDRNVAQRLGWSPAKMPDDVVRMIEAARTSDERAKLKGRELQHWIKQ